jgi:hypothetical protein
MVLNIIILLKLYEYSILEVIDLFVLNFNERNPTKLWRNGSIERIGYLGVSRVIEYSFNGAGCTVSFPDGRIVCFDFDINNDYYFNKFKFLIFIESIGINVDNSLYKVIDKLM